MAEIGINHNGDLKLAKELVDAAAESGVDAVKFQCFKTEYMYSRKTPGFEQTDTDIFGQMKKLELKDEWWPEIKEQAVKNNLLFSASVFDDISLKVIKKVGLHFLKVDSSEITNHAFLEKQMVLSDTFVISTGMSYIDEIAGTVSFLRKNNLRKIILLECTSAYPAESPTVYLNNIPFLGNTFEIPVGFSDHTIGIHHAVAAVAVGARLIEKHFTVDKELPGPDQALSSDTAEMTRLVRSIREIETSLRQNKKMILPEAEKKSRRISRNSVIASKPIQKGDVITKDNTIIKRPGLGIAPEEVKYLYGRKSNTDIETDSWITWDMVE